MKYTPSHTSRTRRGTTRYTTVRSMARQGFTLVEILVVLAVIAILAGILLPVLRGAGERANQTNCSANLQQIYTATSLYFNDEKRYPNSLAHLLPAESKLNNTGNASSIDGQDCDPDTICLNKGGLGYLRNAGGLLCPSADAPPDGVPFSSYGDVSTAITTKPTYTPASDPTGNDMARYVWNYWGYTNNGTGYVAIDMGRPHTELDPPSATEIEYRTKFAKLQAFMLPGKTASTTTPVWQDVDITKLPRMANRYSPDSTIITHCVFHRIPTASRLASPKDLYTTPANDTGAKDVVLRKDGSVKTIDVTTMQGPATGDSPWVLQNFQ